MESRGALLNDDLLPTLCYLFILLTNPDIFYSMTTVLNVIALPPDEAPNSP